MDFQKLLELLTSYLVYCRAIFGDFLLASLKSTVETQEKDVKYIQR